MSPEQSRRFAAEGVGALILTATVIGSGILAEKLAAGNAAVTLLGNTLATAAMLYVLITALGPISGAHFNPAVTLVFALRREIRVADALAYALVQIAGCVAGAALAHAMFELPVLQISTHARGSAGEALSEGVATFALVAAILLVGKWKREALGASVALTIAAGYWWTASTSFANPAITIARSLTDTFAGVRPIDIGAFILAQLVGAIIAALGVGWLDAPAKQPSAP